MEQYSFSLPDLKKFCTDFYFWWHNSKGTNTYQGFDEWIKTQAAPSPAKAEQEGPTQASLMLDELCELVFNDRLYGTSAGVSGRPHDPDPEISKVKRKILDLISTTPPVKEDYEKKYKEANQFIIDLAKEFGQEGLGYDDLSWSIEEFTEAARAKFSAPVKEAGQPRNLPIEELIKLSDEELNVEINKVRSRLGMGKSEEAGQPAEQLTIADYEQVLADNRRLVREIDVILNGDNAARQASLCDLIPQIRELVQSRQQPEGESAEFTDAMVDAVYEGSALWQREYDACRKVLQELVTLKVVKDAEGKTEEYQQRQPQAWEAAIQFLNRYQHFGE